LYLYSLKSPHFSPNSFEKARIKAKKSHEDLWAEAGGTHYLPTKGHLQQQFLFSLALITTETELIDDSRATVKF